MIKTILRTEKEPDLKKQKREKSKAAILKAAFTVFSERGFAGASMSQIARLAQVPQALIYHYFLSKEDLWKAVKQSVLNAAQQSSDFGASQVQTLSDFRQAFQNRADFYRRYPELRKLVQWEALEPDHAPKLVGVHKTYEGIWTNELQRLQDQGQLASDVDPKLLSVLLRSALEGIFDEIPLLYDERDQASKQDAYLQLLERVLGAFVGKNAADR